MIFCSFNFLPRSEIPFGQCPFVLFPADRAIEDIILLSFEIGAKQAIRAIPAMGKKPGILAILAEFAPAQAFRFLAVHAFVACAGGYDLVAIAASPGLTQSD